MTRDPRHDRILELLADEALGQLSGAEVAELERLLVEIGATHVADFEQVIAAADVAMHSVSPVKDELPAGLADRLGAAAGAYCAGRNSTRREAGRDQSRRSPVAQPPEREESMGEPTDAIDFQRARSGPAPRRVGRPRMAIAAVLAMGAAVGLYLYSRPAPRNLAESRMALLGLGDTVQVAWADWAVDGKGPEIPGVRGDVAWSDSAQKGYMRFTGLPANDPQKQQYQLWIIDKERGMSQRISGGVFNGGPGETIVEIEPRLLVHRAAAFAVTIEQPGGTWVSDMTRRVNIAPVPD